MESSNVVKFPVGGRSVTIAPQDPGVWLATDDQGNVITFDREKMRKANTAIARAFTSILDGVEREMLNNYRNHIEQLQAISLGFDLELMAVGEMPFKEFGVDNIPRLINQLSALADSLQKQAHFMDQLFRAPSLDLEKNDEEE